MHRRHLLALAGSGLLMAGRARAAERVLQVVAPWDIGSLEPSRSGYVFTRLQVSETLLRADPKGVLVPGLATAWTASPDGLSWRFTLRQATFHDGTAVSPTVVAQALRRVHTQPGPFAKAPVAVIEADGPALLVRLTTPFTTLPAYLAHYTTAILAPSSYGPGGTVQAVIGSGPYRVAALGLPLHVEVERSELSASSGTAQIARARYLSVPRAEARALMAESGQADLAFTLDPPSLERQRRSPRVTVTLVPIPRMEVLKLNAGGAFFGDLRVRQAVSMGIDRAGIAKVILGNPQAAATQLFPPTLADWHRADLPPLRRDRDAARRLLDQAGWVPGPGGVRVRDGVPFRVVLRTYADRPELPVAAAAIQDQLRELGLAIEVAIVNSSEIPAGHQDGTLQMALMARNFGLVPDPLGTLLDDYGPQGGDWGAMGWHDRRVDEALAGLTRSTDPAEQRRLRAEVAGVLQQELPGIPVAWYDHSAAVSRRVAGVVIDPFELSYNLSDMRWAE